MGQEGDNMGLKEIQDVAHRILGRVPSNSLMNILSDLDLNIRVANCNMPGFELRSTQLISLVVMLWEKNIISECED